MPTRSLAVLCAVLISGCMAARGQAPVERPMLDVPPAPPRVIEQLPPPEPPPPAKVPDLPEERITPPPKPRPSTPKDTSKETAKPEASKPEIPPVEQPPAASPAPAAPPLRTPRAAEGVRIREILTNTQNVLNGIHYQRLRPERRSAYDQAKSHIEGAEAALKAQDFDLAKELADKAEKLARELSGTRAP